MKRVLGIDTSGRHGSVALAEEGAAIAWGTLPPGGHSSGLSDVAGKLLGDRGLQWTDLAGLAVSSGPGSFTGLRIGMAWAKGMCLGAGIPMVLVSAHEAGAAMHRREGERIATIVQGERGEAQVMLWSGGSTSTPVWGPESVLERDLAAAIRAATDHEGAIGVAAPDLRPELRESLREAGFLLLDTEIATPAAIGVAEVGHRKLLLGETADLVRSAPAYGRSPNARKPTP